MIEHKWKDRDSNINLYLLNDILWKSGNESICDGFKIIKHIGTIFAMEIIFSINHILKECTYTLKEEKEKRKTAETFCVNSLLYY